GEQAARTHHPGRDGVGEVGAGRQFEPDDRDHEAAEDEARPLRDAGDRQNGDSPAQQASEEVTGSPDD
ncbi:MAG: hypothetical protein WCO96_08250, partial [Actinomycetes bacterium]